LRMKKIGQSIVVITTHNMSQAERLADWLLLLRAGRIVSV